MKLYFVSNSDILKRIPAEELPSSTFVCFNWKTLTLFRKSNLTAIPVDAFISEKEGTKMDEFLAKLRSSWYLYKGTDITYFKGISIGKVYEHTIWWETLVPYFKFLLAVDILIKKIKPSQIWIDKIALDYVAIIKVVAENEDIEVVSNNNRNSNREITPLSDSLKDWKTNKTDIKREILTKILNIIYKINKSDKNKTILVGYYSSLKKLVLDWPKTRREYKFNLEFLAAPMKIIVEEKRLIGTVGILDPEMKNLDQGEREILDGIVKDWQKLGSSTELRHKFSWDRYCIFDMIKYRLDQFFEIIVPKTAAEIKRYDESFALKKPAGIVLPFDVPPTERMVMELSKKYDVPSITILHGIPFSYNNYDNNHTDFLIVPSYGVRKEYQKVGKKSETIRILGSPKFDECCKVSKRASGRLKPMIVILTYPKVISSVLGEECLPEEYIVNAIEKLKDLEAEIIVKLHPSESLEYYNSILPEKNNVHLIKNEPIETLIDKTDVIVSTFSTVLFEAMIVGKQVVCFNPSKKLPYPEPYITHLPVITDYEKLRVEVKMQLVNRVPPDYSKIIKNYVGEIDGKSTRRIMDFIEMITNDEGNGKQTGKK